MKYERILFAYQSMPGYRGMQPNSRDEMVPVFRVQAQPNPTRTREKKMQSSEKSDRTIELDEPELPDDYPIYGDFLYVADGKVIASDWHGITAREFKRRENVKQLCRCDIYGRRELSKATGA